ncbi:glycosyltransferase [Clostridium bornimense]|uniref:glycosyltransferase family protein n=1 Tax=Clostridium bornimense TaxID=1216932 RepID=UPI001C1195B8|nr:glycosyltransferase [Clostridium bornimense]MBU5314798.1 glycosyltransferase [Clostridium bornimense]
MKIAIISHGMRLLDEILKSYKKAFERLGCRVITKSNMGGLDTRDIIDIANFKPDFVIGYGTCAMLKGSEGFAFRIFKIPVISLFYDNPFLFLDDDMIKEMESFPEYYYSFIWDEVYLDIYNKRNLPNGHKILLALDREKFYPMDITKKNAISMVGSMPKSLDDFSTGNETCDRFIEDVINLKIDNIDIPVLEICDYLYNNVDEYRIVEDLYNKKPYQFWRGIYSKIHVSGGTRYRTFISSIIDDVDIYIYGECELKKSNIYVKEEVEYGHELCRVYNSYDMNLNLSTLQLETSINNRPFDCFGSKSFLLSDYKKDMEVIFPDHYKEITFKNLNELGEKGEYYLTHEKERREITEELYNIIINNHTYIHRARYILDILADENI